MSKESRGQTTLDFTIGVTIFIVVLAGVFLFVPGTLEPFEQGEQEDIVVVNRVADGLSEQLLVEPTSPHVLNETCAVTFFADNGTTPSGCEYEGSSLFERVGIDEFNSLNVTIRGNATGGSSSEGLLCYDEDKDPGERLESKIDCGDSSDVKLAVGETLRPSESSVTARRIVEIEGRDVFLVVELW